MPKPSFYSVTLPTKRYIAMYLQSIYGSPMVFNRGDYFGMVLSAFIEKRVYRDRSAEKVQDRFFNVLDHPMTVHFHISFLRNNYHDGSGIKPENAIAITKLFEERFEEDLYRFCDSRIFIYKERKKAIEAFAQHHGLEIPEDITYDNLKQMEYRFRMKVEQNRKKLELPVTPTQYTYIPAVLF